MIYIAYISGLVTPETMGLLAAKASYANVEHFDNLFGSQLRQLISRSHWYGPKFSFYYLPRLLGTFS